MLQETVALNWWFGFLVWGFDPLVLVKSRGYMKNPSLTTKLPGSKPPIAASVQAVCLFPQDFQAKFQAESAQSSGQKQHLSGCHGDTVDPSL